MAWFVHDGSRRFPGPSGPFSTSLAPSGGLHQTTRSAGSTWFCLGQTHVRAGQLLAQQPWTVLARRAGGLDGAASRLALLGPGQAGAA